MPPREEEETKPSQSIKAWYGELKPRMCTPDPNPQLLQQHVMHHPKKNKKSKIKQPVLAAPPRTQEYHRSLKGGETYHNKVKALKYLDLAKDPVGLKR